MSGFLGPTGVSEPPNGAAGGDLAGSFPNPTVPGVIRTLLITVARAATTDSTLLLPAGSYVHSCQLKLTTPYSLGATISIGQVGSVSLFQATTDNNPQGTANDIYEVDQLTSASNAIVRVTIGGAPAVGASQVLIKYSIPNT